LLTRPDSEYYFHGIAEHISIPLIARRRHFLRRLKRNHFSISPRLYSLALLETCKQIHDEAADYVFGGWISASLSKASSQSTFQILRWRFEDLFTAKPFIGRGCCDWDMESHLNKCLQFDVLGLGEILVMLGLTVPREVLHDVLKAEAGDRLSGFSKVFDALRPSLRYAISTLKSATTLHIVVQDQDARRKLKLLFAGKVVTAHLLEWLPKLRRVQVACEGVIEVLWDYAVSDEVVGCNGSLSRSEVVVMRCLEAL
jgi:hypothetical protein